MNTVPATASVVVIGAGPAGMTAGIALADAGVDVVLLDQLAEGANTSRAAVVHARTLEVLDEFGVAGELTERGLIVDQFDLNDGARRLATVGFDGLPTRFPYALLISQATTEEVLLARLRKAGGTVLRPYTVSVVKGDETGVTIEFTDAAGDPGSIRADYVIGADGMHSVVREQAGIGFTGASYPESFALADVRMDWPDPRTEVSLHLAPQGFMLVAPLPDEQDDRFRIVATIDEAPEYPDLAFMQAIIDDRHPGGRVREVLWSSRFRVHHRLADHYRAGRILLAGDAAHVHSPAGGQGMNTGIQDGALLGQLLARVLHGEPDILLDQYEAIRRPIAQGVVALTDRMTRMATLRPRPARALRNAVIRIALSFPGMRRAMAFRLAELTAR
ncbi:FAD-dependent oxidoreductase [Nocardia miyunensis]|uniref:FAD-dependent oxidoreductase n=1 Tax=Nocardia miyunensis TaxID=282684 RepID=UPI0008323C1A|nr:FAD-dependent monooxygenase [Nocardia miyunensis]